jgi:hypothetical protein
MDWTRTGTDARKGESPKTLFWGLLFPAGRRRGKARLARVCSRTSVSVPPRGRAHGPKTKPVPFFATRKVAPRLGWRASTPGAMEV